MKKDTIIEYLTRINNHFEEENFDAVDLQRISYYLSNIGKKYEDKVFQNNVSKEYNEKETEQKKRS